MGQEGKHLGSRLGAEWVWLGTIGRPFGVKGWVHVHSRTQNPDWFAKQKCFRAVGPSGDAQDVVVAECRFQHKGPVLRPEGCEDRDLASTYTGLELYLKRSALPALPEGEYYWHDMVGFEVTTTAGNPLGHALYFYHNGAHDVLCVEDADHNRQYLPFVMGDTVIRIAPELQRIQMDWIDGDN